MNADIERLTAERAGASAMTVEDVNERAQSIWEESLDPVYLDDLTALYLDVLRAIADGAPHAAELALTAVTWPPKGKVVNANVDMERLTAEMRERAKSLGSQATTEAADPDSVYSISARIVSWMENPRITAAQRQGIRQRLAHHPTDVVHLLALEKSILIVLGMLPELPTVNA